MSKYFKKIIEEICKEENINIKTISKDWIMVLEKEGKSKIISGYKFDLNNHALGCLLDDKYATYELLKEKNFPVINHNILYPESNNNDYAKGCNNEEYLIDLFHKYDENIVLKINDGTCGINVLHFKNLNELISKYRSLTSRYNSLSVCPYYKIQNEYRAIVLNNNVELLYKKIRPVVTGDGKSTVKELFQKFNKGYFYAIENAELHRILEVNEVYEYDWRFNLSRGAKASNEIDETDYCILQSLATEVSKGIGLGFGSIDIIKTTDNKFLIMEINSGVMMDNYINQIENGYQIAKDIYKKALIW